MDSFLSSLVRGIKNIRGAITGGNNDDVYETTVSDDTSEDSGKQTLNEQINNGNISFSSNNSSNINDQILNDEPSGIDALKDKYNQTTSAIDTASEVAPANEPITKGDEDDRYSFWDEVFKPEPKTSTVEEKDESFSDSVNNWINRQINSLQAKSDYEEGEKFDAIGYDEDSGDVLYLDLNDDRGLFDADWGSRKGTTDLYNTYLSEFILETDRPGVTDAEYAQAWQNFYNKAKGLFRVRGDDYYTNGLFSGVKRRKNMYTDEELSMLSENDVKTGRYTPSFDEFAEFVTMKMDNDNYNREIYKNYGLLSEEEETENAIFDVSGSFGGGWMGEMRDIALQNIDEMMEPMREVNPNAAQEALLTYSSQILGDQLGRYYQRVAPVYKYEREIRSRAPSTWSEYDKYLLDTAAKFREMDKAFAAGLNDWFRQVLLYGTNQKGDIVNSIDVFENGESLSDVLTKEMKRISGIDWALEEHQSALDIVGKMANDAIYQYQIDKVGALKGTWNALENAFEPVGNWLGEAGQFLVGTSMDVINYYTMGHDSLTSDYLDQDFTIGRLIETDDGNIKRTIKKYLLEGAEYGPEIIGNIIPDIVITVASGGAGGGTFARHLIDIKRTYNVLKAAKGAGFLKKTGLFLKSLTPIALRSGNYIKTAEKVGLTAEKLHELGIGVRGVGKTYQTLKTGAQLADRFITDFSLGQLMDAQRSAYDTEPYSQASFLWSMIPSVVFDAFPHIFRAATGRGWFKWMTGMDQGSVWSLAKYIDSSPEAAENVARALGKSAKDINLEDLKLFAKNYSAIEDAAKQVYEKQLTAGEKAAIGKMTKQLAYNYVNQAFGSNSITAKRIRAILANGSTNIADVVKYLGRIPGEVSMGPFVSTIKFKNGTRAVVSEAPGKRATAYSPVLDAIFDGGFDSRVKNGFSQADIDELSKVKGYYSVKDNKSKFFNKVVDDKGEVTYFLNEDGLKRFGLKGENMTLESLGVSLAEAEKTKELLTTKLEGIDGVKISKDTIGELADTGGYDEIVSKVKEVLGC